MKVNFVKYEGAGNDFVLLDTRGEQTYNLSQQQIASICDRHFGIGADGLMMLGDGGEGFDFSMRYFNADGGESTMCGNGGRCIVRFADDLGIGRSEKLFSAIDAEHHATIHPDGTITISMIDVDHIEQVEQQAWLLNTGSPHLVIENRPYNTQHAKELRLKYNCNVNFIELIDADPSEFGTDLIIGIQTYERGVEAETLACGTGATAAAIVINYLYGLPPVGSPQSITVMARGGRLTVGFSRIGESYKEVTLTGEARKVFCGVLHI